MHKKVDKLRRVLLLTLVSVGLQGCQPLPEASFELAQESRLPKWVKLPPGILRADVSLTMHYYVSPSGRTADFILQDKQGRNLASFSGTQKGAEPIKLKSVNDKSFSGFPIFEVITVNGMSEVVEHRKVEPMFYINDDPEVKEKLGVK
jgi:hypothetical protein